MIEFYNFSEVGQNYEEKLVGTFSEFAEIGRASCRERVS